MKKIEGNLLAKGMKFYIVSSRFNEFLSNKLIDGAVDALTRHGAKDSDITLVKVPGAFEIPSAAAVAADSECDAVICLGVIIRGETPHFNIVAAECAKGIAQVSFRTKKPVVFGIIVADNLEQAIERAGTKQGNKGFDAAVSAIEMANLFRQL